MDPQIFSDGIGQIVVIGGTVRLDFVAFSQTEKDSKGQPLAVFRQRVIMCPDGFLQSAAKIREAVEAMSKLSGRPPEAAPQSPPEPSPSAPIAPPKRPFP